MTVERIESKRIAFVEYDRVVRRVQMITLKLRTIDAASMNFKCRHANANRQYLGGRNNDCDHSAKYFVVLSAVFVCLPRSEIASVLLTVRAARTIT